MEGGASKEYQEGQGESSRHTRFEVGDGFQIRF